jgi:hypothetical protein
MAIGTVLSPASESVRGRTDEANRPDPRLGLGPDALAGAKVGIRGDNLWQSWEWVTDEWAPSLSARGAELSSWKSATRGGSAADQAEKELADFLVGLDVAIVGLGTCGSCTMWTMHDALAAHERGIPTVAIITRHFAELARNFARRAGEPDFPIFLLPYPLETRPESEVREIARAYLPRFLATLGAAT